MRVNLPVTAHDTLGALRAALSSGRTGPDTQTAAGTSTVPGGGDVWSALVPEVWALVADALRVDCTFAVRPACSTEHSPCG